MSIRETSQSFLFQSRVLAWFSCGAASAVSAKLAIQKYGSRCTPVYCNSMKGEHPDNERFLHDCERWFRKPITIISSLLYSSPDEVFEATHYISGPKGARCTTELKKIPRQAFQCPDDIHIFGFTSDESDRIQDFESRNPDMRLEWLLRDNKITKQQCYRTLLAVGISLPAMYLEGYPHNNCIGCVKATSPGYWNKTRRDYPDVFNRRAEISRRLGVRLVNYKGNRIFLDELPLNAKGKWKDEVISCGPDCASPS